MSNASNMRRIWRFLPSSSMISSQQFFSPDAQQASSLGPQKFSVFAFSLRCVILRISCVVRNGADLDVIRLLQVRLGRGDTRTPFGIIGQQQQALACFVQAAPPGRPTAAVGRPFSRIE